MVCDVSVLAHEVSCTLPWGMVMLPAPEALPPLDPLL